MVDKKDFEAAVDRVSTMSSERGRAVKLSLSGGKLVLSVTNPDSGSATEELEVEYDADPLDIGFNSRYLLDIAAPDRGRDRRAQARRSRLADADPGQGRQGRALRADADAGVSSVIRARCSAHARVSGNRVGTRLGPAFAGTSGCRSCRMTMTAARIRRLTLTQFPQLSRGAARRSSGDLVVLVGPNGAGKTNLLEAISFLAPGRGLRRATLDEVAFNEGDGSWAVSAEVEGALGLATLGTGIERAGAEARRSTARRCRIDREPVGSAAAFADHLRMVWLTPAMDGLFLGAGLRAPALPRPPGAGGRRRAFQPRLGAGALAALAQPAAGESATRRRTGSTRSSTRPPSSRSRSPPPRAETVHAAARRCCASAARRLGLPVGRDRARRLDGECAARRARDRGRGSLPRRSCATSRARDAAAGRTLDGPHLTDLRSSMRPKSMPAARRLDRRAEGAADRAGAGACRAASPR